MDQYFGHKPQDWERSMIKGKYDGSGRMEEMQRAMANPDQYTTTRPNMTSEAAFTVDTRKGAGKGLQTGNTHAYYKIEKQAETAPAQQTPAPTSAPEPQPEPEVEQPKDDLVIKRRSPEIQEAKERVNNYQLNTDTNSVYTPSFQSNPRSLDLEKYKFNPQGAN